MKSEAKLATSSMQMDRQYPRLVVIPASVPCNMCIPSFFVSIPSPVTLPDVLGSSAVPSHASLCRLSLPPPSNAGHGSSSHLAGVATSPSKYTRRRSCAWQGVWCLAGGQTSGVPATTTRRDMVWDKDVLLSHACLDIRYVYTVGILAIHTPAQFW